MFIRNASGKVHASEIIVSHNQSMEQFVCDLILISWVISNFVRSNHQLFYFNANVTKFGADSHILSFDQNNFCLISTFFTYFHLILACVSHCRPTCIKMFSMMLVTFTFLTNFLTRSMLLWLCFTFWLSIMFRKMILSSSWFISSTQFDVVSWSL